MAKRGRKFFIYVILLSAKADVYFKPGFLSRRKGKNRKTERKKEKSVTIITWTSQGDWQLSPLQATGSPVIVLAASHSKPE